MCVRVCLSALHPTLTHALHQSPSIIEAVFCCKRERNRGFFFLFSESASRQTRRRTPTHSHLVFKSRDRETGRKKGKGECVSVCLYRTWGLIEMMFCERGIGHFEAQQVKSLVKYSFSHVPVRKASHRQKKINARFQSNARVLLIFSAYLNMCICYWGGWTTYNFSTNMWWKSMTSLIKPQ